ncbi:FGGY-family carbohydrate kinase [Natronospirillum operosum]|nr:FGGY family carbohydrate kinase [Natronospirillum operosum]
MDLRQPVIAVLDIGKTNVKLCAIEGGNHGGALLAKHSRSNGVVQGAPYPHVDDRAIWHWVCEALAQLAREYHVTSIAITTHGATAACLAGDELALPILDYESPLCQSLNNEYRTTRPAFEESGSPDMAVGLNLGRQLYWLSRAYRQAFERVTDILLYPQYWGWLLSGVKASEVTSLGCHTDLWDPMREDFSSLTDRMGWRELLPDLQPTGEVLGPVQPELAARLGLPEDCMVCNGIHDSNASLVPHLLTRSAPFTVVSSGTWTVICSIGASAERLQEDLDMLVNVNAYGEAVPTIRFMGGREWETLRGTGQTSLADLKRVMTAEIHALPAFSDQGGPFRHHAGRLVGPVHQLNSAGKTALASVYCALMTDYCLDLLGSEGDIVIEGAFARNDVYMYTLATLRAQGARQDLYGSSDSTGTTQGTAMLGQSINHWPLSAAQLVAPLAESQALLAYAGNWRQLVKAMAAAA